MSHIVNNNNSVYNFRLFVHRINNIYGVRVTQKEMRSRKKKKILNNSHQTRRNSVGIVNSFVSIWNSKAKRMRNVLHSISLLF